MPEAENRALAGSTNDSWRTWLMTGARRTPADRRRVRGAHKGLKKMLLEGMSNGDERPHAWKDFSGAMIRHAVDEAMRTLAAEDKQVVKLAYFGGYSNHEIAVETGLTEATVQRRLRRALAAISEHIQHGRALGRRAMYVLTLGLSARWLSDLASHVAPAAVAAAVTVIVVSQPAPSPAAVRHAVAPASHAIATPGAPPQVDPAPPSPTAPATPSVPKQVVQPLPTPALPTPIVKLPRPLPTPPVHVPLRS
jgi:RNA polymerase sigma factor (sigma-70 family)